MTLVRGLIPILLPGAAIRRIPVRRRLELHLDAAQICHNLVVSAILYRGLRGAEVRVGIRTVE